MARAQQGLQHTGRPMEHSPGAVPSFLSQVNLNTIKRCLLTNYSPSFPDPDFRDCIQVVLRASWGMTKRLQQTFPRQELTVGHR